MAKPRGPQRSLGETCPAQIGPAKVSLRQVGTAKIAASQHRTAKVALSGGVEAFDFRSTQAFALVVAWLGQNISLAGVAWRDLPLI